MPSATVLLDEPVNLRLTLGPLRHGGGDPTIRFTAGGVWRATRTDDGPATVCLRSTGLSVEAEAWGPGAERALASVGRLVGAEDRPAAFQPDHPVVAGLHRSLPGLRIPCTGAVFEALLPTILEQKVTGIEAKRSYRRLVDVYGEPAPGPGASVGLQLPPRPEVLAGLPYHAFHPYGVERRRADTIRRAAAVARRLEETAGMPLADAYRRLMAVPGIGAWTAAEVAFVALGDADAVSVGDYHLPHQVVWALTGRPRGDDAAMLELLEPFRGQRGRVCRLLVLGGGPPRRAPRARLRSFASI